MSNYMVSEAAAMAGISVRALHHYHEIGLLAPAYVGENGYRYYGRKELLRLQQILIHRALGIPLAEIGEILDAPAFDRLATLRSQRARIAQDIARSAEMLRTIDRTIAELEGDRAMKDADLYSGIVDPKKQAEYEAWLEERYGPQIRERIEAGKARMEAWTENDVQASMMELKAVEEGLAEQMKAGKAHDDPALDLLIDRHRSWVGRAWNRPCPQEAYLNLADVYQHPDFRARYESVAPGFADFLIAAMKAWVARQR